MNSFNHYAYGASASFLYSVIGGIRIDDKVNAFRRFIIAPVPCGDLTFAETTYLSPCGKIHTSWKSADGKVSLTAIIPANTTALLQVNGLEERELGSGTHTIVFDDPREA